MAEVTDMIPAGVVDLEEDHNCLWCTARDKTSEEGWWIMVAGCFSGHIHRMFLCHKHKNEAVESISLHGMYCSVDYSHMIEEAIFSSTDFWDSKAEIVTLCHCEGSHHPEGAHSVAMRMVS
jgi:hypothetical protein